MRTKLHVCLSAICLILCCAFFPQGRLFAQQAAGAPAPAAAQIDQLTAPIALYPDALLFQIVAASADVGAVQTFAGWLEKNAAIKGSELQAAAQKAGFSAALVALAPFPQVVQMMVQKPDWTKALGQADKNALFDSVQRLRAQAMAAGNLKTTSQQKVETQTTTGGQQVIVIQPANPQVIYVPTYNPQVIYVQQAPPPSASSTAAAGLIGFTAGVLIAANNSDHYHSYDNYWDKREDYYQDRQEDARANQDQRQSDAKANQDQRQSTAQGNQDQRQTNAQAGQDQRQSTAQANQGQRQSTAQANQGQQQSGAASAKPQDAGGQSQRQNSAGASSRGGQSGSQRSGTSSGSPSSYQSGSATRAQSSRGSSSLSSSEGGGRSGGGGGGGGGRSGGGRR